MEARETTQSQFCAEAAAANRGSSTQRPRLSLTFSRTATESGLSSSLSTKTCSAVARNNDAGTQVCEKVRPVRCLWGVVVCCRPSHQHRSPTKTVGGALSEDSASARSMPLANNFDTAAISGALAYFFGPRKVQTTSSAWGLSAARSPLPSIRRFEDDARRAPGPRGSALCSAAAFSSSRAFFT